MHTCSGSHRKAVWSFIWNIGKIFMRSGFIRLCHRLLCPCYVKRLDLKICRYGLLCWTNDGIWTGNEYQCVDHDCRSSPSAPISWPKTVDTNCGLSQYSILAKLAWVISKAAWVSTKHVLVHGPCKHKYSSTELTATKVVLCFLCSGQQPYLCSEQQPYLCLTVRKLRLKWHQISLCSSFQQEFRESLKILER